MRGKSQYLNKIKKDGPEVQSPNPHQQYKNDIKLFKIYAARKICAKPAKFRRFNAINCVKSRVKSNS